MQRLKPLGRIPTSWSVFSCCSPANHSAFVSCAWICDVGYVGILEFRRRGRQQNWSYPAVQFQGRWHVQHGNIVWQVVEVEPVRDNNTKLMLHEMSLMSSVLTIPDFKQLFDLSKPTIFRWKSLAKATFKRQGIDTFLQTYFFSREFLWVVLWGLLNCVPFGHPNLNIYVNKYERGLNVIAQREEIDRLRANNNWRASHTLYVDISTP